MPEVARTSGTHSRLLARQTFIRQKNPIKKPTSISLVLPLQKW
jgi:hypothetical protein